MKKTDSQLEKLIEGKLYRKASALVEEVRKQEVSQIFSEQTLLEADPKPRVEKDHKGEPVIPSKEQFQHYFEDMASKHIEDQLRTAHDRWKEAATDEATQHAIDTEIEVANSVLRNRHPLADYLDIDK